MIARGLCLRTAVITSLLLGLAQAGPAWAQQTAQSATGLEEIIVTARKIEESIQRIPLAVTAFTSEDMSRRAVLDMNDIAQNTPGFNYTDFGGNGNTSPTIRGATQIAGTGNAEQNVSFFFDGIYLPRSYLTNLGLDGIERVEVVAGPQSARYGRNAFMGVVNYISRKPSDTWQAEVTGTIGTYSRFDGKAYVSGPVVDGKLSALAGFGYSSFDGSWENPHPFCDISFGQGTDCRSGGWDKMTWNGAVTITPTDNLKVDLEYFHWKNRQEQRAFGWFGELGANSQLNNCGQYNPNVRPASAGGLGAGGQWYRLYCGQLPILNTPVDPRAYGQQIGASLMRLGINYAISETLSFDYIYGRVATSTFSNSYTDVLPGCPWFVPGCVFQSSPNGSLVSESHEARVSYNSGEMLRAAVGFFYSGQRDRIIGIFGPGAPLTAVPTRPMYPLNPADYLTYTVLTNNLVKDKVYSPFAEVNVALLDKRLRLGGEVRWTQDNKLQAALPSGGGGFVSVILGQTFRASFKSWTPRFTVEYDLTPDSMIYASAARGVKSGGFNVSATVAQYQTFNPDANWTYELGSKNTFGNFRINGNLFLVKWKAMQIPAADPTVVAVLPRVITLNLGNVTSKGVELQGAWAPSENITIEATGYYGDPRFDAGTTQLNFARSPAICDNVVCPTNGYIGGKVEPRASKWMGTLGAEYRGEFGGSQELQYYGRGELTYQSKAYVEEMNLAWVSPRTLMNVTLGVTGKHYEIQFWVRNLFDKVYIGSGRIDAPNVDYYEALGDRRTLGVTAKIKY